jgi:hypothetical protein
MTWTYRVLWLLAILLVGAMPLIIVGRGDVWLGSISFDESRVMSHALVVVDGDVAIRAPIDYPMVVFVGNVTIDAPVHNDLVVVGGNVSLTSRAVVDGNLVALVGQVYRAPGATVSGTIGAAVRDWSARTDRPAIEQVDLVRQVRLGLAMGLGLLLICLVVAAMLPWSIVVSAATARKFPIRSSLAAATSAVALPLVLLPLVLSLVGLPIAVVLSGAAVVVWLVGLTAAGYLVGRRLLGETAERRGFFPIVILGLAPLLLTLVIPVLGPLFVGAVGFLGAGGRIVSFVERERTQAALDAMAGITW